MDLITLFLLALALGTDAFSLCLGIGMTGIARRQVIMISLSVLAFHIIMPLIGWQIGEVAGKLLGEAASITGALLLLYLGVRMIWHALRRNPAAVPRIVVLKGWGVFLISLGVSVDALAVGFNLSTQGVSLFLPVVVFGLVAGLMTLCGLLLGRWLGYRIGERAQLVGGVVLVGIGVKLIA